MNSKLNCNILFCAALFCLTTTAALAQDLAQTGTGAWALARPQLPPTVFDRAGESKSSTLMEEDQLAWWPGHHLAKALSASGLELTDAQVERLTVLRQDFIKSMISPVGHMVALVVDMKEALTSSDLNDDRMRSLFAQMKTEIDSSYAKTTDHMLAVAHVFTPDQRQKMKIAIDRAALGALGMRHHEASSPTPQHDAGSSSGEKH